MARKKIREYDSKRLLKEHLKRLVNIDLQICSAQVNIHNTYSLVFLCKLSDLSLVFIVVRGNLFNFCRVFGENLSNWRNLVLMALSVCRSRFL